MPVLALLPNTVAAFARRQSAAEMAHQFEVLRNFNLRRRALVTLAFGVGLAYLPVWVMCLFFIADCTFDFLTLLLLEDLDPARQPFRYVLAILANTLLSATFTGYPALCWLIDAPLARAYALAMVLIALIHHSTLRNIHLPLSISASVAATTVAAAVNTWLWASTGQWQTLAITTLSLMATVSYAFLTIFAMHKLQADLLREREAAAEANRAKSRFIAQLSHELRTPLNALIGLSEAERMMAPLPETKARMAVLADAARDLGGLLEDILDLSAIEAGRLTLRPEVVDLRKQIGATAQLFRRQFEDRGMRIIVDFAEDTPRLVCLDGRRLRQCLANVLSNAVKYGQQGEARIAVSRRGELLEIAMSDDGPGVPQALRERIFEPFVRGHQEAPGTGLGLSISRTLARRMGGDLVLLAGAQEAGAQEAGAHATRGARFLLTLPMEPLGDTGQAAAPTPGIEGMRVLVVDDIATNRLVAATWLRLLGAEALPAADGTSALEIAPQERPDAILMDLLMPGLDGETTLRLLRQRMGADLPPVLAVSAEAPVEDAALLAQGFAAVLAKPLTLEALREALGPLRRAKV